jgi:hydrogenase nickel incorporation protein HypA/HybF
MHELSIAQNILEIIKQNIPANELSNVECIRVKIGEMSGVVPESLEFCFQAITSDNNLNRAVLDIEKIPFVIKCNACNKTSTNDIGIRICRDCGSSDTEIVSGIEMQVVEVELKTESEEVT